MADFFIIRLGKDSVDEIRTIDSLQDSPDQPLEFTFTCSQVPMHLNPGAYAFLWLGSDNSKGGRTDWLQGLRAFGVVTNKSGGPTYRDTWHISFAVYVVFPRSITRQCLLDISPTAYCHFSGIPVIGINITSNQTVQPIKPEEERQNINGLFYAISKIAPNFKRGVLRAFPELDVLFTFSADPELLTRGDISDISSEEAVSRAVGDLLPAVCSSFESANIKVSSSLIKRFIAALLTKRFVILTGLSGSGKTKLAHAFAMWFENHSAEESSERQSLGYRVVSVGSDWDNSDHIFGYADMLRKEQKGYHKPANKILDLIIEASKAENRDKPFFLILDEMNLSHVERYFADILSSIETGEPIVLHSGCDNWGTDGDVPPSINLPDNLFIVGTVNIDETTYLFSPKVLDRANVIEFRISKDDMQQFFQNTGDIHMDALLGGGSSFAAAFVSAARKRNVISEQIFINGDTGNMVLLEDEGGDSAESQSLQSKLSEDLLNAFDALASVGAEFGYRTASEIRRYFYFFTLLNPSDADYLCALDTQILQKLLPKLHGSIRKLDPVLESLTQICTEQQLPLSLEKVQRMRNQLENNGFTSFAEA